MIYQTLTDAFLKDVLTVYDQQTVWKLALYQSPAELNRVTPSYTTENEVSGAGYPPGGFVLTAKKDDDGNFVTFEPLTTPDMSVEGIVGGLIYTSSRNDKALIVLHFGKVIHKNNEPLVITFPDHLLALRLR